MCNACGNHCCGSDEFGGCGCDGCFEPDCWSGDVFDDEDGDYGFAPRPCVPLRLECVEATP